VDAINLRTGELATIDLRTLAGEAPHPDLYLAVSLMADGEMKAPLFRTQDLPPSSLCLTFENLLTKSAFVPLVKKVLSTVQAAYGRPVDIEFAWDENKLYILQCRSLSLRREVEKVVLPTGVRQEDTLFVTQSGLSNAVITDVEYLVYVDPRAYDRLDTAEKKHRIGRAVGELNRRLAGKRYALLGPGRWGSNDINLGVPVSYADINNTRLLVEIAFARDGYTPEVSYGTHFFADLVEADIAIMPLFPDNTGSRLNEDFLLKSRNSLVDLDPGLSALADTIRVIHVPSARSGLYLHVFLDGDTQKGMGMIAPATGGGPK
ncbi:MAG TPA: PEP/pyruvate-binding domain-containing protein, partial [Spirochaetia bacterium]|nr:PEP/pyruvate-binding domain-containing protein [Spirochaetia bacterium]